MLTRVRVEIAGRCFIDCVSELFGRQNKCAQRRRLRVAGFGVRWQSIWRRRFLVICEGEKFGVGGWGNERQNFASARFSGGFRSTRKQSDTGTRGRAGNELEELRCRLRPGSNSVAKSIF